MVIAGAVCPRAIVADPSKPQNQINQARNIKVLLA
jgi:hypothetical protein